MEKEAKKVSSIISLTKNEIKSLVRTGETKTFNNKGLKDKENLIKLKDLLLLVVMKGLVKKADTLAQTLWTDIEGEAEIEKMQDQLEKVVAIEEEVTAEIVKTATTEIGDIVKENNTGEEDLIQKIAKED